MAKPLADDAGAAVWSDVVVMLMTHGSAVTQFHRCDVVVAGDVIVSTVTVDAIGSGLLNQAFSLKSQCTLTHTVQRQKRSA